jgi:hypothetical protein
MGGRPMAGHQVLVLRIGVRIPAPQLLKMSDALRIVVRHHGKLNGMALKTRKIEGNEVRIPDPQPGEVAVISRYGRERAMLFHPVDFHRLSDFERFLAEVAQLEPVSLSSDAVRAHREEDTPGEPITDPARLAEIFG